jgi:BppU N-terminal domain
MVTIFLNNLSPSLTDTLTSNNLPVDLSGATVKFRMREEASTTLKTDTAAVIVNATAGQVRYDWVAQDVDTAGDYVAWWQVTFPSAKTQDTPNFIVRVEDHVAPTELTLYVEAEELKSTLGISGMTFADEDIQDAIVAASRAVDGFTGRRFYKDAATTNTRTYVTQNWFPLLIDDLVALGAGGVTVNGASWVQGTDYRLVPYNAAADGRPYDTIAPITPSPALSSWLSPPNWNTPAATVTVQGQWGWPSIPQPVVEATRIEATRLLRRTREATFGVVGIGPEGSAVRLPTVDPDVALLLAPFKSARVA